MTYAFGVYWCVFVCRRCRQIEFAQGDHGAVRIPAPRRGRRLLLSRRVHTEIPERFHGSFQSEAIHQGKQCRVRMDDGQRNSYARLTGELSLCSFIIMWKRSAPSTAVINGK